MSEARAMGPSEWGMLGLLSLLWGGSFFFSKVALAELPPLTVVLARVALAALALRLFLALRGIPVPATAAAWRAFLAMGLLNSLIPFTLIFWGQGFISSGLASILNATTPVFSILVARFVAREEGLPLNRVAGIALGLAGVALLLGGAAFRGAEGGLPGILACLGAALFYGFANSYGRRFRAMGISPAQGAFGQIAATALLALPLALAIDRPWRLPAPAAPVWAALAGLALLSTALAYILFFRLIATAGATNTSLVTLLVPVSAILLGAGILGERLSPFHLGGMALIGLGLLALDGRLLRRRGRGHDGAPAPASSHPGAPTIARPPAQDTPP
ncbi:DMT family transporter [Roseomonas sp. GC11]|uniref:DMT family transporter n=1 Tax=Roseomonas sp. GC11 TaxID=2950546 RepID=UPI00210CB3D8|nr:DMT family transporter [Roseomonas sp. GC11]MCQ4162497.1 DMT family transporter [Roseomonas sp. GC11]